MTTTVKPSTLTYLIQQHLLRHAKPKSPYFLFRRSFSLLISRPNQQRSCPSFFFLSSSISSSSPPQCSPRISLSSILLPKYLSSACESEQDKDNVLLPSYSAKNDEDEEEEDGSDRTLFSTREIRRSSEEVMAESSRMKLLSVKEKKKIASYAHSLGDKLKCQLVGKSGVTDPLVFSVIETLEKNELLKVKIHRTCPGTLEDMILDLEEATGSVAVGKIGRTVILYRPSPTIKREEEVVE